MIQKKMKASAAANGPDALENVVHDQAINDSELTQNLRALQAKTIARRHRLAPSHAHVIASLAFAEGRA